ncbi:hypothetical protein ACFL0T_08935 [Candidatus Omnitrophota bacterium]
MEKKRSIGVTVLSFYLLLCAIPALFAAFIGGISGSHAQGVVEVALDRIMRILFISSPVLFVMAGIGLSKLKNWARLMTMFLSPILSFIAIGMSGIFLDVIMPPKIVSLMIPVGTVIMSIGIIFYLTRPNVKQQFMSQGQQG